MKADPRNRKLVTGDEAIETTRQHTKPCRDCPWARKSLRGWLGGATAQEWVEAVHGEAKIDCHTATVQCAGAAIFRGNVFKLPRNTTCLKLPSNREIVFGTDSEFFNHHENGRASK